tara:strand:+ start:511 stop:1026 length:516 start_codon:yes stop_codon:yes gene_type:complete
MNQLYLITLLSLLSVVTKAQELPFYISNDTVSMFRLDYYIRNVIDDRTDFNIWADSTHDSQRYDDFRYEFEVFLKKSIVPKYNAEPVLVKVKEFKVWENQTDSGLYAKEYIDVIYYLYANLKFIEVYSSTYTHENTSNRERQNAHMVNVRAIVREMFNDFELNSGYKLVEY